MLSPFEAEASRFPVQHKPCPTALGPERHALPCDPPTGWGQAAPRRVSAERTTTRRLLEQFSIGSSEANAKALDLMRELRELTQKQHLELRRSFGEVLKLSAEVLRLSAEVLKLSAEARKEAALVHQEAWEEAQGPSR